MQADYAGRVEFLVVYIREAHAANEWPLGTHVVLRQPATLEERIEAAQAFKSTTSLQLPMLVDGIDDGFMNAFRAHPLRYYVFHRKTNVWTATPYGDYPKFEAGYKLEDIRPVLDFRLNHT